MYKVTVHIRTLIVMKQLFKLVKPLNLSPSTVALLHLLPFHLIRDNFHFTFVKY